jgi:hypothetical protein
MSSEPGVGFGLVELAEFDGDGGNGIERCRDIGMGWPKKRLCETQGSSYQRLGL